MARNSPRARSNTAGTGPIHAPEVSDAARADQSHRLSAVSRAPILLEDRPQLRVVTLPVQREGLVEHLSRTAPISAARRCRADCPPSPALPGAGRQCVRTQRPAGVSRLPRTLPCPSTDDPARSPTRPWRNCGRARATGRIRSPRSCRVGTTAKQAYVPSARLTWVQRMNSLKALWVSGGGARNRATSSSPIIVSRDPASDRSNSRSTRSPLARVGQVRSPVWHALVNHLS